MFGEIAEDEEEDLPQFFTLVVQKLKELLDSDTRSQAFVRLSLMTASIHVLCPNSLIKRAGEQSEDLRLSCLVAAWKRGWPLSAEACEYLKRTIACNASFDIADMLLH